MLTLPAPVPSFIQLTACALSSLRTRLAHLLSPTPPPVPSDPALLQRWQRLEAVGAALDFSFTPQELVAHLNTSVNLHLEDVGRLSVLCRRIHPTERIFKFSLPTKRAVDGFLLCCMDEGRQVVDLVLVPNMEDQTYVRLTPQQVQEHAAWSATLRVTR